MNCANIEPTRKNIDSIYQHLMHGGSLDRGVLYKWMNADDEELQGFIAYVIAYKPGWLHTVPALNSSDLVKLLVPYYRSRLVNGTRSGEWADSRYEAAQTVLDWFRAQPRDAEPSGRDFLHSLKEMLADIYIKETQEVREAVVTGALEHILEEPRWRRFFGDWDGDEVLGQAYHEAMEWARAHERADGSTEEE